MRKIICILVFAILALDPLQGSAQTSGCFPISGVLSLCEGTTTTLSNDDASGTWSSSNTSVATVGTSGVVTGLAPGTVSINYIHDTCTVSAIVTVDPAPGAVVLGIGGICIGNTTLASSTTSGGTWSSSDPSIASVSSTGTVTGVSSGTASISYLAGGCYSMATIIVSPEPSAISGTTTVCAGSATTLASSPSGGVWSSSNTYHASINSSSGVLTGVNAGTSRVSYVFNVGCYVIQEVTVNFTPSAITGVLSVCNGSTTALGSATTGGVWTSAATSVATIDATTGVVTGVTTGTSDITYTLGSCFVTAIVTVDAPTPSITGDGSVCVGQAIPLSNSVSGGSWSSADPSVATINGLTGLVIGVSSGTTVITYTASAGCYTTTVLTVNAAVAGITGTLTLCAGATTTLVNSSGSGTWASGNTTKATIDPTSGLLTAISAGTSMITYTQSAGCFTTAAVSINPVPTAFSGTAFACEGASSTLSSSPSGGTWSSGTTATATISSSGVFTGIGAGTSTISYVLATGCAAKADITINATPATISGALSTCIGSTSTLSTTPTGGFWSSSNTYVAPVNSTTGVLTGSHAGTARVTYTLSSGCYVIGNVTVVSTPAGISGSSTLCAGSTTTLTTATGGGTWVSSDGAVATVGTSSGVVTGIGTGTAIITYAIGACQSTKVVTVSGTITANTGSATICAGQSTDLDNATSGGTWSSSSTSVATVNSSTGLVTGVGAGTATISYMVGSGCYSNTTVTVNAGLPAITGPTTVCPGTTTALGNATGGGTWTSSNLTKATIDNTTGVVTGVNAGTTRITYDVSGCFTTAIVTVYYNPGSISGGTSALCVGATTGLSCSPGGGTWSSGDALVATVSGSGVVTATGAGTATITYTLGTGCTSVKVVTVNALPVAITGTLSTCIGSTSALSSSPASGVWTSSNNYVASVNYSTGVLTGNHAGTSRVSYTLPTGCYTISVATVSATPSAITGVLSLCLGSTTSLSSPTFSGTWTSSDGATATVDITSGVVTGVAAGTATISYSNGTCATTKVVTVTAAPTANTGLATICVGQGSDLDNATSGGTWSSSNTAIATVNASSGIVTGVGAGTATITYRITSSCFSLTTVTVNAGLPAIAGTLSACPGSTTALSNATGGGTWASSNTAKATIDVNTGVVTGVSAGTTTITYEVAGCYTTSTLTVYYNPGTVNGTASICEGATTGLTCSPGGGTWSSGDLAVATVGTSGIVAGVSGGTAIITYTTGTGCTSTKTVTINALPSAITGTLATCIGNTTALSSAPASGFWSSSSTYVATVNFSTGVVTGSHAGTTRVSYMLPSGCSTFSVVTVSATPSSITGTLTLCAGSTTNLGSATFAGAWTSDNGAVATVDGTTGVVTGVGAGTSTISYSNGTCAATAVVTVSAGTAASTGDATVCVGQGTTLSNASPGGTWSSSATSIAVVNISSGVVSGVNAGTANITYTLSPGCYSLTTVTVNASLASITGTLATCPGTTTALGHAIAGGTWSSSNTAAATIDITTGVATGVSPGTTTISYVLSAGCYRTTSLVVNSTPAGLTGTASLCVGSTTTLSSATSGGAWSSADAGTASVASGVVTGVAVGTTTITYTLGTGCQTTRVVTVTAAPDPITGTASVCVGGTSTLVSAPGGGAWSSSNTSKATIDGTGVVTGVNTGTSTITYALAATCISTINVTVNTMPSAISGLNSLCAGGSITLSSSTPYGVWSSTNGAVATIGAATGVVDGIGAGTTTISYAVGACAVTKVVTVNVAAGTITGDPLVCVGQTNATLTTGASGGTWSSSASGNVGVHSVTGLITGNGVGTATITYTSSPGCFITTEATTNAAVNPIAGPTTVIVGNVISLTNATAGGTWSSSNTFKATVVAGTGDVTGAQSGTATISYIVSAGCYTTNPLTVTATRPTGTIAAGGMFSLFPNPSTGSVTIESSVNGVLAIVSIDGRMIEHYNISEASTVISLPASLSAGVYMCQFKGEDGTSKMVRLVVSK